MFFRSETVSLFFACPPFFDYIEIFLLIFFSIYNDSIFIFFNLKFLESSKMHSVKKVEEKARLAREEKRKKKMFELDIVRKKVFKCFQNLPGNERTILDLTEGILTNIPDLYSFWVMRREVLMKVKEVSFYFSCINFPYINIYRTWRKTVNSVS